MSSRLGVLGGMFDPVHNGHIEAACFACNSLALDRVKLIPCYRPNHRGPATASPAQRLAMLELATASCPALEVDAVEVERAGISYTVDTVSALRESVSRESASGKTGHAGHIVFILGMDAFNGLPSWHRWQDLLALCHLLVLARPGSTVTEFAGDTIGLRARQVNSPDQLFAADGGKILIEAEFDHAVSSSDVRRGLGNGADLSAQVNGKVLRYIEEHGLYRQQIG